MTVSRRLTAAFTAAAFAAVISGCATSSNPQPSVYSYPAKGQTPEQQARDSSECQMWAKQQSGWDPTTDTAKGVGIGAAVGALGGAALGAAVGAAAGSPGTGAAIGAAAGGVGGATYGGTRQYGKGKEGYDSAYAACMNGRGYTTK
jgi:outer membrane lipoprotein SlyB